MNLTVSETKLHTQTLAAAQRSLSADAELLDLFQQVDRSKLFRKLECRSLYEYGVKVLKLPEGQVYALIRVARKAVEVPELKTARPRARRSSWRAWPRARAPASSVCTP